MEIEEILDVELPSKMAVRGRPFTRENNPQSVRWKCLDCNLESNLTGIIRHQNAKGHIGKQRLLL